MDKQRREARLGRLTLALNKHSAILRADPKNIRSQARLDQIKAAFIELGDAKVVAKPTIPAGASVNMR